MSHQWKCTVDLGREEKFSIALNHHSIRLNIIMENFIYSHTTRYKNVRMISKMEFMSQLFSILIFKMYESIEKSAHDERTLILLYEYSTVNMSNYAYESNVQSRINHSERKQFLFYHSPTFGSPDKLSEAARRIFQKVHHKKRTKSQRKLCRCNQM